MQLFMMKQTPIKGNLPHLGGSYMSTKYDGHRALWIPSTRGIAIGDVPFANRSKDSRNHVATGLWSSSLKVIHAPVSHLDSLPQIPLDGELWVGRGKYQETSSIVKRLEPDYRWESVKYMVHDSPPLDVLFADGEVQCGTWKTYFSGIKVTGTSCENVGFSSRQDWLKEHVSENSVLHLIDQQLLPNDGWREAIESAYSAELEAGGEGLIFRHQSGRYIRTRVKWDYKLVPELTCEGVVTGYSPGEGKYARMIGAFIIDGGRYKVSGMRDELRYPGVVPIGTRITVAYRELTDSGIPKCPRFKRIREDE